MHSSSGLPNKILSAAMISVAKNTTCHYFKVYDDAELDRKRLMLSTLLECDGGTYSDIKFIDDIC